jgi:predicted chitinase
MPVDSLGKLSLYTGTKQTDSISEEDINDIILRLLGLEDTFDIDYDTYKTLLKQRLIENQILTSKGRAMPSEEAELLTGELKRIKGKVGRFTIKKKKIGVDAFKKSTAGATDSGVKNNVKTAGFLFGKPGNGPRKTESPASSVRPVDDKEEKKGADRSTRFVDSLKNIGESLQNILNTLRNQSKSEKKEEEKNRREKVRSKRSKEEEKLEKKRAKELKKLQEQLIAPIKGPLERIWNFIKYTFLGAAFNSLMKWISDPKNAKKVEVLGRLLKTFWPALLAAFLLFMTPFGGFVRNTIKLVGFFAKGMAKIMPMLLSALRNLKLTAGGRLTGRGKVAAAAGLFLAGAAIPALFPGTVDAQERKTESAPGSKEEKIKKLQAEKSQVGLFDPWGKKAEIDEQIYRLRTGETKRYAGGGRIFSGFVGHDTGTSVTGAGQDTQLMPVEGGGSAVLAKGELVLNEEQQQRLANETGVDPAKFAVGGGGSDVAGQLRPVGAQDPLGAIRSQTQAFSQGGIIGSGKIGSTGSQSSTANSTNIWDYYSELIKSGKFKDIFTQKPEPEKEKKEGDYNSVWNDFVKNAFLNHGLGGTQTSAPKTTVSGPSNAANTSTSGKIDLAMGMWRKYRDQKDYKNADAIGKNIWNLKYGAQHKASQTPNPLMKGFVAAPTTPSLAPVSVPAPAAPKVEGYAGGGRVAPAQLGAIVGGANAKNINSVYKQSLPLLFQMLQGGRWKDKGWGSKEFMQMLTARMLQESHNFTKTRELADVSPSDPKGKPGWNYFNRIRGYGNNPALGNKGDADGYNFIGRGPVQLTGRANYEMFNKWLQRNGYKGYDVVKNPGLIEKDPKVQALSVLSYLENRQKLFPDANLAQMASSGNLKDFVYAINGGHHGLDVTQKNLQAIKTHNVDFNKPPSIVATQPQAPKRNWVQRLLNRPAAPAAKPATKPSAPAAAPQRSWYDPRGWVGKKDGGSMITENTGMNIPGATADRQLVALQPGENHYIFTKRFVDRGGLDAVDNLVAQFDPHSAPAKDGRRSNFAQISNQVNRDVPGPPVKNSGNSMSLPAIRQSAMSGPLGQMEAMDTTGSEVPIFSAAAGSGIPERSRLCEIYGIVG